LGREHLSKLNGMNKGTRILVIDDDPIFLHIANVVLKRDLEGNVEVFSAQNKSEIAENMQHTYDAIFIDLNMPETTGWEVIELYKEKLMNDSCAVIICSSSIDPRDQQRAQDLNDVVDKMIAKPIDTDLVRAILA